MHPTLAAAVASLLAIALLPPMPRAAAVYDVRQYGARGDGTTNDTDAILAAFAACHAGGVGGDVLFGAPGIYIVSALAANCNHSRIFVEPGATVRSVNTTVGWPLGLDSPEPSQGNTARQAAPFLLLHYALNVTLTGGGTLDARGGMFWAEHCGNWWCPRWANATSAHPYAWRPFLLRIADSRHVTVVNLTLIDPGFWCIVPTNSHDVTVAHTRIVAVRHAHMLRL